LRWEIDNVVEALANERAYSGPFHEGGFIWSASIVRDFAQYNGNGKLTLTCGVAHKGSWKCEVEMGSSMPGVNGENIKIWGGKMTAVFSDKNRLWIPECGVYWKVLMDPEFANIDGKCTIEFQIKIIHSEGSMVDLAKMCSPIEKNNVTLVLLYTRENKRIRVSKEFLAVHSPVFEV
ncbi:hypothetical protein PMAYCL1PPCAC_25436, partial [Pristionchus mayeri]